MTFFEEPKSLQNDIFSDVKMSPNRHLFFWTMFQKKKTIVTRKEVKKMAFEDAVLSGFISQTIIGLTEANYTCKTPQFYKGVLDFKFW